MSLGIDPVTIGTAITVGSQLWNSANQKDRERLQKNSDAYKLAVQGHQNALEFLKYRSGRYGQTAHIGPPINEGPIGGWATQIARDDAFRLYNSALAAWGVGVDDTAEGAGSTPAPGTDDRPDGTGVPRGLPGVTVMGTMSYLPLLAVGAAIVLLSRRRGR